MHRFYTKCHFTSLHAHIALLALSFSIQPAFAAKSFFSLSWLNCRNLFSQIVYRVPPPPPLSAAEKQIWVEWFSPENDFPQLHHGRISEEIFWHIYSKIPPQVRERFEQGPDSEIGQRYYLRDVARQLGLPYAPANFFEVMLRKYSDARWSQPHLSLSDWVAAGLKERDRALDQDPHSKARWEESHQALLEEHRAVLNWQNAFMFPLKYEMLGGGRLRVVLNKTVIEGYEKGGWTYLKIPAELAAHPAWNPMPEKAIMEMAQDRVPPPPFWYASLGHDGRFYLQDGNKRFAISAQKEIWVQLPFPPQTAPLTNYLDHWGISQPERGKIIQLYRKEIGFKDMVPEHVLKRLIFKP